MKKEAVEQIAKVLQTEASILEKYIESGEGFTLPEIMVKKEVDQLIENTKKERFEEGKKAALEIWTKDQKVKYPDIKFDGKDPEKFVKAFVDHELEKAKIEPNTQIDTLKKEKTDLQTMIETLNGTIKTKDKEFESKMFLFDTQKTIESFIPEKTKISKDKIVKLFLMDFTPEKDDTGKIIVKKGSEVLKDKVLNPVELKTVVQTFIDENQFLEKGGAGGGSGNYKDGDKFTKFSDFHKYAIEKGIKENSAEYHKTWADTKAKDATYD